MTVSQKAVLEVCCFNAASAVIAAEAGASRIELCEGRDLDGFSPSKELILQVTTTLSQFRHSLEEPNKNPVPLVHVMVRPKPTLSMLEGGPDVFVLSDDDKRQCMEEITWLGEQQIRVDGVVVGSLERRGAHMDIDWDFVQDAVRTAKASGIHDVTFHRCFDYVADWALSPAVLAAKIEELARIGVTRVLTAGTANSMTGVAERIINLERVAGLAPAVADRSIAIMPAGGINAQVIRQFISDSCLESPPFGEFHGSFLAPNDNVPQVDAIRAAITALSSAV